MHTISMRHLSRSTQSPIIDLSCNPMTHTHLDEKNSAVKGDIATARFNLSDLYSGVSDPRILADLADYNTRTAAIREKYRGKLADLPVNDGHQSALGNALSELAQAEEIGNKLWCFVLLSYACNQADDAIKGLRAKVSEQFAKSGGENLSFLDIEICQIPEGVLQQLTERDLRVKKYRPYIDDVRRYEKHNLSEEVERALSIRRPFGPSEVCDFVEEEIAGLKIRVPHGSAAAPGDHHEVTFEEALTLLSSPDGSVRAQTLKAINATLGDKIQKPAALALNLVAGSKSLEDGERGYKSPMHARNLSNKISLAVVDALHAAVENKGAKLARRYYRLLAKQLKQPRLAWSDRLAPVTATDTKVPWGEAVKIVVAAYQSFSPTLAKIVKDMIEHGRLDAPTYQNKQTGAFNLSVVLPAPLGARSYNMLNYTGRLRDVAVFAHEAGHAAHGILAGEAQGPLMSHPPMAYAETASVFGEMITFQSLYSRLTSDAERLPVLMSKISDFMNTVVRQINFSSFEQRLHEARKTGKLSAPEISKLWVDTTIKYYGAEGDVFEYRDMENMWTYISHFHRPFYVYSYAFGELLTQSLYAEMGRLGDRFEPLYLDLLRAGGTKDAVELLKPFGLNPEDPAFWERGMAASAEKWIELAERLSEKLT